MGQTQKRVVPIEGEADVTVTAVPRTGFVVTEGAPFTWSFHFDAKG